MRELLMKLGLGKFIQYYEKYFGERKTKYLLRLIYSIFVSLAICAFGAALAVVIWIVATGFHYFGILFPHDSRSRGTGDLSAELIRQPYGDDMFAIFIGFLVIYVWLKLLWLDRRNDKRFQGIERHIASGSDTSGSDAGRNHSGQ